MTRTYCTIRLLAEIATAAILLAAAGTASAQTQSQKPPAKVAPQAELDPYPKGYTPEDIADAALMVYIRSRAPGMLRFEETCWKGTIEKIGKMMTGKVCKLVALANVAIDADQRQKDGLEPTPEFDGLESQLRFGKTAQKNGLTEDQFMSANYMALRDGHARLLRHLKLRGLLAN